MANQIELYSTDGSGFGPALEFSPQDLKMVGSNAVVCCFLSSLTALSCVSEIHFARSTLGWLIVTYTSDRYLE